MTARIDDFDLILKKTEKRDGITVITETRNIQNINVESLRKLEQKTSAEKGSDVRDTGRDAAVVFVEGEFIGREAADRLGDLRRIFKEGNPVEFVSDLGLKVQANRFVIDELHIENVKGSYAYFKYTMRLREHVGPS